MHISYDFLALGAALCWALSALTSVTPVRHLGPFAFTRWRMLLVTVLLWVVVFALGTWRGFSAATLWPLVLSGLIGIFVGDTAMFASVQRLGPRRTGVLYATHAVFSTVLGMWWLGERLSLQAMMGGLLTVTGVMTAIFFGSRKDDDHAWERNHGRVGWGVALGLLSALCQSLGSLIAKPIMVAGADAMTASAVRVSAACLAHFALLASGLAVAKAQQTPTPRILGITALNGFIGMGVGMSLILLALKTGDAGLVGIFSSVTPVLLLPLLWLRLGRAPAPGAWLGAALTVAGTVTLILR